MYIELINCVNIPLKLKKQTLIQMKKLLPILCLISFTAFTLTVIEEDHNEITGQITMSNCPKLFVQGTGYNADGTEVMHSDDPLAKADRNVIISLHPLDFKPKLPKTKDAYISQSQQTFLPNVLPVVVGSKVHFLNEDEFFHNVQSYTPKSRFSIGRRAPGISYSVKIKKVGEIQLSCDIHAHMNAKILSFDTPYFTRIADDGAYHLKDLPDGDYRIEIFHPDCSKITDQITLKGGKIFEFNYNLSVNP
nr:copper binding protein, plastocyanin/azurin family [uncultured bacterium]